MLCSSFPGRLYILASTKKQPSNMLSILGLTCLAMQGTDALAGMRVNCWSPTIATPREGLLAGICQPLKVSCVVVVPVHGHHTVIPMLNYDHQSSDCLRMHVQHRSWKVQGRYCSRHDHRAECGDPGQRCSGMILTFKRQRDRDGSRGTRLTWLQGHLSEAGVGLALALEGQGLHGRTRRGCLAWLQLPLLVHISAGRGTWSHPSYGEKAITHCVTCGMTDKPRCCVHNKILQRLV